MVEQNMRDLKRLGVKVIDFTGGEPLLHRDIDTLLRIAKKYGMITTLTSNALLYPKWAARLKGLVDMLHFSLDSPDKEVHDTLRGVTCFDFVLESIQISKQLGERPDIIFTVFDHNIHLIKRMYEEICLPNNLILILNPSFEYNQVEVGTSLKKEDLDTLSYWAKQKNIYINEAFIQLRLDGGNHTADPICKAASSTLVISPENKLVLPCYHLGTDSFVIDNNLFELYHSKEVKAIIAQEGTLAACEGCTINCYMQPSFAVEINKYWFKALPSTLKYSWEKGTWKQLFK